MDGHEKNLDYYAYMLNNPPQKKEKAETLWDEWMEYRDDPKTKDAARKYEKDNWITMESFCMYLDSIQRSEDDGKG